MHVIMGSDISVSATFEDLSVNMVSTSDMEDEYEDEEVIQSDTYPWIKYLNTL